MNTGKQPQICVKVILQNILESFRLKDEDDYKFSRLLCKNRYPRQTVSLYFFFTTKVSTLISVEGGKTFPQSLNDKISNI